MIKKLEFRTFIWFFVFKTCPHLQFSRFYTKILWENPNILFWSTQYNIANCVFLCICHFFDTQLLEFIVVFINFGKLSGIYFFKYFSVLFFPFYFQDLNYPYARPFDIAQQLSHNLLLFVFSFLFVCFFLSLSLRISVWMISTVLSSRIIFPAMSSLPVHQKQLFIFNNVYLFLSFTFYLWKHIFFISMIKSISIYTHCSSFPLEKKMSIFTLLPELFHCPCQRLPKLVNLCGCSVASFTVC